jgi:ferredoxin--NADP+ reductase
MSESASETGRYRVAIVGSGPAGFYAAEHLLKRTPLPIDVDMFERLPVPFGLVRFGVAPDHQKIKAATRAFERIADDPAFRFLGNVEIGRHLTVDELRRHYHGVCIATGAETDRSMGIPGENLAGSHAATEFVAWYNGHPDHARRTFDLSVERVSRKNSPPPTSPIMRSARCGRVASARCTSSGAAVRHKPPSPTPRSGNSEHSRARSWRSCRRRYRSIR